MEADNVVGEIYNLWNVRVLNHQHNWSKSEFASRVKATSKHIKYINNVRSLGGRNDGKNVWFKGVDAKGEPICDFKPYLGYLKAQLAEGFTPWIVHSSSKNDTQSAFRIPVSSDLEMLGSGQADTWNSKKISSTSSINVSYRGKALLSNQFYYWKVKTWCKLGGESKWSCPMMFRTGDISQEYITTRYPLTQTDILPSRIVKKDKGHYLIDFGKVSFGYLRLEPDLPEGDCEIEVHFGESGDENGVNKKKKIMFCKSLNGKCQQWLRLKKKGKNEFT